MRVTARRRSLPRRRAAFPSPNESSGDTALLLVASLLGRGVATGQLSESEAMAVLQMAERLAAGMPRAKELLRAIAGFIATAAEASRARAHVPGRSSP